MENQVKMVKKFQEMLSKSQSKTEEQIELTTNCGNQRITHGN